MENLKPENQVKTVYGIFNKHTKVLYAIEDELDVVNSYSDKNFLVKEIQLKPHEYFFGDYDTGQVYDEYVKPLIREDELLRGLYQQISQDYSFFEQLCILTDVLNKNEHIVKTEEFDKLAKYLKLKKMRYTQSVKAIKDNPDLYNFLSKEQILELDIKRNQGIV